MRNEEDWHNIVAFLKSESPDVMCVQEARLVAQGPPGCQKGDGRPRQQGTLNRGSDAAAKKDHDLVTRQVGCHVLVSIISLCTCTHNNTS